MTSKIVSLFNSHLLVLANLIENKNIKNHVLPLINKIHNGFDVVF